MKHWLLALLALLSCAALWWFISGEPQPDKGLVVETVSPGSGGERAGIRPGDHVLRWERVAVLPHHPAAQGRLVYPLDWLVVEQEQAPIGSLHLLIERGGSPLWLDMPQSNWQVKVRPRLDRGQLHRLRQARAGERAWSEVAPDAAPELSRWLQLEAAEQHEAAENWEQAAQAYRLARRQLASVQGCAFLANQEAYALLKAKQPGHAEQLLAEVDFPATAPMLRARRDMLLGFILRAQRKPGDAPWRRAEATLAELAPDSLQRAELAFRLGQLAKRQQAYAEAERHLEEAARIYELQQPFGEKHARVRFSLGSLLRLRGYLARAEQAQRRALEVLEQADNTLAARALTELGHIANDRRDLEGARTWYQQALAAHPAPRDRLWIENGLGVLYLESEVFQRARNHLATAALLATEHQPASEPLIRINQALLDLKQGHMAEADALLQDMTREADCSGIVAYGLRLRAEALADTDPNQARDLLRRARQCLAELGEQGFDVAETHAAYARNLESDGQFDEALTAWSQAVDAIEDHLARLGGGQLVEARFALDFLDYYKALQRGYLQRRDADGAFAVGERYRGPIFQRMLATRGLALPGEVESQRIGQVTEAASYLDPGTLALVFSVHESVTHLFVLERNQPLQHIALEKAHRDLLTRQVDDLRGELSRHQADQADLEQRAARLYQLLLAPVSARIQNAQRLLILPDGPLHRLPFAALRTEDATYLGLVKPLHTVLSLTRFGQLVRLREKTSSNERLLAFGNPHLSSRWGMQPLPDSADEVDSLASRFPERTIVAKGSAATEHALKQTHGHYALLHLAMHARLDDRDPMDTHLLLRDGNGEDGRLNLEEIMTELPFDSELVVLSACYTALGREMGGEGMIGLARAFQLAGARCVLASLWQVEDQATARLMFHFYAALDRGLAVDAALLQARSSLASRYAHPFYWAGFRLDGDPTITLRGNR